MTEEPPKLRKKRCAQAKQKKVVYSQKHIRHKQALVEKTSQHIFTVGAPINAAALPGLKR